MAQLIKTERKLFWTRHSQEKIRFYRLSESRVKRVLRYPERIEIGVAPKTTAVMQTNKGSRRISEIWAMYQDFGKNKRRVISAWRYPGESPAREPIPIPADIRAELKKILKAAD